MTDTQGTVAIRAIDPVNGSLGLPTSVDAGDGAHSIAIDGAGRFAYVANFNENSVSTYAINAGTGGLTAAGTTTTVADPSSVGMSPSGEFVYVTNRLDNSVSAYSVNKSTGALVALGAPVATGSNPYCVTVATFLP